MNITTVLLFITLFVLNGCELPSIRNQQINSSDENEHLRVMYKDEESFKKDYGFTFNMKYPDVEIEVISTEELLMTNYNSESLEKYIHTHRPDVFLVNLSGFEEIIQKRHVLNLEPIIQKEQFDLENFAPTIIDFLKQKGSGTLYGLTPNFTSKALFYNIKLFDEFGIPYPTDYMTWEEVFQISSKFPEYDKIPGYYKNYRGNFNPFSLIQVITENAGLHYVVQNTREEVMSNSRYEEIFDMVMTGYKTGYIYNPINSESNVSNLFLQGKAAMTRSSTYFVNELNNNPPIHWDVVTEPVDIHHPEHSFGYDIQHIYAINVHTKNELAAWQLLKHIHSEQTARIKSSNTNNGFSTRTAFITDKEGRDLSAFYRLKPIDSMPYPDVTVPSYHKVTKDESLHVLKGEKSVKDALFKITSTIEEEYNIDDISNRE